MIVTPETYDVVKSPRELFAMIAANPLTAAMLAWHAAGSDLTQFTENSPIEEFYAAVEKFNAAEDVLIAALMAAGQDGR